MNTTDALRVLETALICATQPLTVRELGTLFDGEVAPDTLKSLLADLQQQWTGRGVELVQVASGWRFQSRPELAPFLERLRPEKPPRYSRAVLETLAIIAYRQPVTRGDIEDIRGVGVTTQIIKSLEDRGWIESIGFRESAGRPALYATTRQFLDDLGLASLDQLPMVMNVDGEPPQAAPSPELQPSLLEAAASAAGADPSGAEGMVPKATQPEAVADPDLTGESEGGMAPEPDEPAAADIPPPQTQPSNA